jgi:arylsulfatase A-like enzyme
MHRSLLFLLLILVAGACSEPAPARLFLFDGPRLVGQLESHTGRLAEPGADGWLRIHEALAPEARQPTPWPSVTRTSLALPGLGTPPERTKPHELRFGGEELPIVQLASDFTDPSQLDDGQFYVAGTELYLLDRAGRFADKTLDYFAWIERKPRASLPGITSDGLMLLAGESFSLELPAIASETAELVFATTLYGTPGTAGPSTFTVEFEGRPLLGTTMEPALAAPPEPHRVPLPRSSGGRLTLRVTGGAGLALFSTPTVTDTAREQPDRPDIIIFLADTFRADNLAAWGGPANLAPNLNRFQESGLTFTGARAPATWTLPSQASLLTSLYPYQHGAVRSTLRLPAQLDTLPKRLRAAGYRTAAVTDGIMVTAHQGLDSGFELFLDQRLHSDFESDTLDRVRSVLALDDGRPLLLYVQSYRAHAPYMVTPETFASHPELFGEDGDIADWDYETLFSDVMEHAGKAKEGDTDSIELLRTRGTQLERLYRGGVIDLDRGFGDFLTLVEPRHPLFVFTSDHGESFFEHRAISHGTSVNEEEARVPLILSGPGIEPGLVERAVTLVDLAPTLTGLVGVAPSPDWSGRSILGLEPVGPDVLSFMAEIDGTDVERRFALYDGQHKVVGWTKNGRVEDKLESAFDLEADPHEEVDLLGAEPGWARALFEAHRAELDELTRPRAEPVPLVLTDEQRADLAAMGYTGD